MDTNSSKNPEGINTYNGRQIGGFKVANSGACVISSACSFSIITWISVIGPTACQIWWINPQFKEWQYLITPLNVLTMCISLVFLVITSMSDPGIIPRNSGKD